MSEQDPELKRPTLVTVLSILTIAGSVFYFGYLLMTMFVPDLNTVETPLWMNITTLVAQIGKIAAAILLLRMSKIGFYLFVVLETAATIIFLLSSKMTMDYMDSSFVNPDLNFDPKVFVLVLMGMGIGLAIIFIAGFASYLSRMR